MPEGSRVGLARLGGAGTNPSLEVPVRCHLAFHALAHDPPAIPPEAVDQDERPEIRNPFAFSARPGLGPVDEGGARAAPDHIFPDPTHPVNHRSAHVVTTTHRNRKQSRRAGAWSARRTHG